VPFANLPPQGTLYIQNFNGIAWAQPGGPNTPVYPQQQIGVQYQFEPTPGSIIWSENSGLWSFSCSHWAMEPMIFQDFDEMLGVSVAVITCPICTCVSRYQSPYSSIHDVFAYPIIIP